MVSYTLQKDHSVDPILQLSGKKSPWKESPHWGQTGKIKAVWSDTVVPSLEWDGNQIAMAIVSDTRPQHGVLEAADIKVKLKF